jgi:hypothetical protein
VDISNVRVEFESGCVANFTASRVSTEQVRKLRFFEPRQYVSIDYARRDLLVIGLNGGINAAGVSAKAAAAGLSPEIVAALTAGKADPALLAKFTAASTASGPALGLSFTKPPVTPGEPLRLEILSFLEAVRTRRAPRVTARQGRQALALALEIQASMAAHAQRAGLHDFFYPGA